MPDDLMQQVYFEELLQADLAEAQKAKAAATLEQLNEIMADHRREEARINSDADLSGIGRQNKLGVLALATGERLEKTIGAEIRALDSRLAELEEQLRPQPAATDPVLQFLIEKEIREEARTMDSLEVQARYEGFARTGGDDDFMRAVENAPRSFPLIHDRSILEAGQRARAVRESRDTANLLRQLRKWRNVLASALQSAESALDLPADDPLRKIAAGKT